MGRSFVSGSSCLVSMIFCRSNTLVGSGGIVCCCLLCCCTCMVALGCQLGCSLCRCMRVYNFFCFGIGYFFGIAVLPMSCVVLDFVESYCLYTGNSVVGVPCYFVGFVDVGFGSCFLVGCWYLRVVDWLNGVC